MKDRQEAPKHQPHHTYTHTNTQQKKKKKHFLLIIHSFEQLCQGLPSI